MEKMEGEADIGGIYMLREDFKSHDQFYPKGTLWKEMVFPDTAAEQIKGVQETLTLNSMEYNNVIECNRYTLSGPIEKGHADLLLGIQNDHKARNEILNDKVWLEEGLMIRKWDVVKLLNLPGGNLPLAVGGIVMYKGPLPDLPGTHFGVKLTAEYKGKGISNGTYRKKKFFECEEDSAVFVSLKKVRFAKDMTIYKDMKPHEGYSSTRMRDDQTNTHKLGFRKPDTFEWVDSSPIRSVTQVAQLPSARQGYHTEPLRLRPQPSAPMLVQNASSVPNLHVSPTNKNQLPAPLKERNTTFSAPSSYKSDVQYSSGKNNNKPNIDNNINNSSQFHNKIKTEKHFQKEKENSMFISVGERVVWISDNGPEYGIVRWCGELPDAKSGEITAGVEFINPVGTGTGKYKWDDGEAQVFQAQWNHASFIPLLGLMRAKEFDAHDLQTDGPDDPNGQMDELDGHTPAHGYIKPTFDMHLDEELPSALKLNTSFFSVGSTVEVFSRPTQYGLIRWVGYLPGLPQPARLMAGIEMDHPNSASTDGTFKGQKFFDCPPKHGLFMYLDKCRPDSRFAEGGAVSIAPFGRIDSKPVSGRVAPPIVAGDVDQFCGRFKGIQGNQNSCYMDAAMFAMFFFCTAFDQALLRPKKDDDKPEFEEIQILLREHIVNPLRQSYYVRADKILLLRKLLDKVTSVEGLMRDEKDPEEFLNSLFGEALKPDPMITFSSGQQSYFYQIFVERDPNVTMPTTQQLLEQSFIQSGVKLSKVPSALILQMPRFGSAYKAYDRILPSLTLDVTDLLESCIRQCKICGSMAEMECVDCFKFVKEGLKDIVFCTSCCETYHLHPSRGKHAPKPLQTPDDSKKQFKAQGDRTSYPLETMQLSAVVCIETSHYVAFVRTGTNVDSQWLFYDSMADRKGESNGYNIPEVKEYSDAALCFDKHSNGQLLKLTDRELPGLVRRMLCDSYLCIYQSVDHQIYQ